MLLKILKKSELLLKRMQESRKRKFLKVQKERKLLGKSLNLKRLLRKNHKSSMKRKQKYKKTKKNQKFKFWPSKLNYRPDKLSESSIR